MSDDQVPERPRMFRNEWTPATVISAVVAMLAILGMLLGGMTAWSTNNTKLDLVQASIAVSQRQIEQTFNRVEAAIVGLDARIKDIPDLAARVALIERQMASTESRNASQDALITAMRERQIQGLADIAAAKTELQSLRQGSAITLPGQIPSQGLGGRR